MVISVGLTLLAGVILPAGDSRRSVAAPQARTPLARGPVPDINLVFSAQAIGWIEPCG
jgi:hypothetical protein